jgi:hypothetical protein
MDEFYFVAMLIGYLTVMYGPAAYAFYTNHSLRWPILAGSLMVPFIGGLVSVLFLYVSRAGPISRPGTSAKTCPSCASEYFEADYRPDAPAWVCCSCKATLPRDAQLSAEAGTP